MEKLLLPVIGYLIGSILFGEIVAKLKGVDIRSVGSGNVGATNVSRALGKKYGVLVFSLDALKGFLPVYVGIRFFNAEGPFILLIGVAPVLGHMFPLFSGFRGGKGVATAFGVLLALSPGIALLSFVVWAAVLLLSRYVSLASMVASSVAPVFLIFAGHQIYVVLLGVVVALLIVLKHRSNIERLLKGEEHRV